MNAATLPKRANVTEIPFPGYVGFEWHTPLATYQALWFRGTARFMVYVKLGTTWSRHPVDRVEFAGGTDRATARAAVSSYVADLTEAARSERGTG